MSTEKKTTIRDQSTWEFLLTDSSIQMYNFYIFPIVYIQRMLYYAFLSISFFPLERVKIWKQTKCAKHTHTNAHAHTHTHTHTHTHIYIYIYIYIYIVKEFKKCVFKRGNIW